MAACYVLPLENQALGSNGGIWAPDNLWWSMAYSGCGLASSAVITHTQRLTMDESYLLIDLFLPGAERFLEYGWGSQCFAGRSAAQQDAAKTMRTYRLLPRCFDHAAALQAASDLSSAHAAGAHAGR